MWPGTRGGEGWRALIAVVRAVEKSCGLVWLTGVVLASSSPGRRSAVPYSSSAEEQPRSAFRAVRMPRRTRGREEHHSLVLVMLDMIEDLS